MAEEIEGQEGQLSETTTENTETKTTVDESEPVSSTAGEGNSKAFEERLARLEERNRSLEETNRLLTRFTEQQPRQPAARQEDELSPESAELDRLLEPIVNRRVKQQLAPVANVYGEIKENQDAIRFDTFLSRHENDLFQDGNENRLDAIYQKVDQTRRRAAQEHGTWISREQAYQLVVGAETIGTKKKTRQTKAAENQVREKQRVAQTRAAESITGSPDKRQGTSGNQAVLQKLRSGQRLTAEERQKLRDSSLGDVAL